MLSYNNPLLTTHLFVSTGISTDELNEHNETGEKPGNGDK